MVAVQYVPNLHQFLRYRRDVRTMVDRHDDALDHLRAAARQAYDRLLQNQAFRSLASSTGASAPDHGFLAEYIINGLRDLGSYYALYELWNREGARFLKLREDPALESDFRTLDVKGRKFSNAVRPLLDSVSALQVELSDAYKLPPVDPADLMPASHGRPGRA